MNTEDVFFVISLHIVLSMSAFKLHSCQMTISRIKQPSFETQSNKNMVRECKGLNRVLGRRGRGGVSNCVGIVHQRVVISTLMSA